jgi:hypothetical protein
MDQEGRGANRIHRKQCDSQVTDLSEYAKQRRMISHRTGEERNAVVLPAECKAPQTGPLIGDQDGH